MVVLVATVVTGLLAAGEPGVGVKPTVVYPPTGPENVGDMVTNTTVTDCCSSPDPVSDVGSGAEPAIVLNEEVSVAAVAELVPVAGTVTSVVTTDVSWMTVRPWTVAVDVV